MDTKRYRSSIFQINDSMALSPLTCLGNTSLSYQVIVKLSALEQCAMDLSPTGSLKKSSSSKLVIITDTNVWKWHGYRLINALEKVGAASPQPLVYILDPGEGSKSRATKEKVEDFMLSNRCLRDTFVLAFGGGVVGDLAGFVAATYMRGVPVIQLPTTLLAMVDSSVGGKTGLDTPAGKNLIGAFHQPRAVYADPSLLITLPVREISNGMAEVVKCGLIADASLFELCEVYAEEILGKEIDSTVICDTETGRVISFEGKDENSKNIVNSVIKSVKTRSLDLELLETLVYKSCAVKVHVVSIDEKEGGIRSTLNFGHTVGHGIEALMQPSMLHGECVAIGMVVEAEASRALGHCETLLVARLKRVLSALKLPFKVPSELSHGIGLKKCIDKMAIDKKNIASDSARSTRCVLLKSIGNVFEPPYTHAVPIALIMRLMSAAVSVRPKHQPVSTNVATSPIILHVPGSKSLSNRVLLLAALAQGTTVVRGLLHSDDTDVMLRCLSDIGAKARYLEVNGKTIVEVIGTGGNFCLPPRNPAASGGLRHLYVQNAGTASRFLTAILCLLPIPVSSSNVSTSTSCSTSSSSCSTTSLAVTIGGNARMAERPIGPLVDTLRAQGAHIEYLGSKGCMPLSISRGISSHCDNQGNISSTTVVSTSISDKFRKVKRRVFLEAKLSSQYVSAILMAAPLFPQLLCPINDGTSTTIEDDEDSDFVEVILAEEKPTSLPYIDMTVSIMRDFGVNVMKNADNRYLVPLSFYTAPIDGHDVEADASSASYPAAIAAVTGKVVVLDGIGKKSVQGDARFPALLGRMGCKIEETQQSITVTGPAAFGGELVGIDVNMSEQTDCFMTLAVVAAIAKGTTRITGIANQRVKECNRIAAMVTELAKCGITARELPDGIEIEGAKEKLRGATIHCYDDHRIAMSFAVLGLSTPFTLQRVCQDGLMEYCATPIILDEAPCVGKTYSEFWDDLEKNFETCIDAADFISTKENEITSHLARVNASIVLIGMRCAGKSTLARSGAVSLGPTWQYIDLDRELERREGCSISDVISKSGWSGFRNIEVNILKDALSSTSQMRFNHVISCGGGVVETADGREILKRYVSSGGVVIHIFRDVDDIAVSLSKDAESGQTSSSSSISSSLSSSRPVYPGGETIHQVYARRKEWYESCSSHIFTLIAGEGIGNNSNQSWIEIEDRFGSFIKHLVSVRSGVKSLVHFKRQTTNNTIQTLSNNDTGSGFLCLAMESILDLLNDGKKRVTDTALSTYTHSFTLPSLDVLNILSDTLYVASLDASAIELRIDCLRPSSSQYFDKTSPQVWSDEFSNEMDSYILYQLALLRLCLYRGKVRSLDSQAGLTVSNLPRILPYQGNMPIIFTVRSVFEGGKFTGSEKAYEHLCKLALRAGCECIDLETGRCDDGPHSKSMISSIADAAHSVGCTVIGSAHWPNISPPQESVLLNAAQNSVSLARADIVKLVVVAESIFDAISISAIAQRIRENLSTNISSPIVIALGMGEQGVLSRALNSILSPVTHSSLPTRAAPGQLSLREIRAMRTSLRVCTPKAFFLFGSPVSQSLSPRIHNTGFACLGLPHKYGLVETSSPIDVLTVLQSIDGDGLTKVKLCVPLDNHLEATSSVWTNPLSYPSIIGGGNVTMPLKVDILPFCNKLSTAAKRIGAVNVLTVVEDKKSGKRLIYGDNTDWLGIYKPLQRGLKERRNITRGNLSKKPSALLVIGAGGTALAVAYAAMKLNLKLLVHNRTVSKAEELAKDWDAIIVPTLGVSSDEQDLDFPFEIVALVCALPPTAQWTAPVWLLRNKPVVFDVCYRPRITPLLSQARKFDCPVIEGIEMLIAQGLAAFSLWTGLDVTTSNDDDDDDVEVGPAVPVAEIAREVYKALEDMPM